jgi:hypothetical protein
MTRTIFIAAALALGVMPSSVSAQVQSIRTYVSITGSDSNPCSLTQPCRHFQAAVNATSAGGEVDALEPGGYGSFSIEQAVTIEGQGWSYVAPPNGSSAITVEAGSGNVIIHGVSLNGAGTTNSTGIFVDAGNANLEVLNCLFNNFYNGILVEPPNGSTGVLIKDTTVLNSSNAGIYFSPTGTGTVSGILDHVTADLNAYGMYFDTSHGPGAMELTINDSHVANINSNGSAQGIVLIGGVFLQAAIKNTTIRNDGNGDLVISGNGPDLRLFHNEIETVAIDANASTTFFFSDGTNDIDSVLVGGSSAGGVFHAQSPQ